ncbi:MAG: hypothetical protein IPM56_10980 [Ignavibacteriales bacterium]|nr:MAG: hypothetical protein IPM56_10980 [Ignavibacteriales bacterium]
MLRQPHPFDSTEQQLAHTEILQLLNQQNNLKLVSKKLLIGETLFQSDVYSACPPVFLTKAEKPANYVRDIFTHWQNESRAAQQDLKDILKMLLIEKMQNKTIRKRIVFADAEAASSFSGSESWYSKLKDHFNIEIIVIDIPLQLKESLINAQKRQYR